MHDWRLLYHNFESAILENSFSSNFSRKSEKICLVIFDLARRRSRQRQFQTIISSSTMTSHYSKFVQKNYKLYYCKWAKPKAYIDLC